MSLAAQPTASSLGEVYTKPWIVNWILDLCGYVSSTDLSTKRLVEPSCGSGAFLLPIVERLIESARQHNVAYADLGPAVFAIDLNETSVEVARWRVQELLVGVGVESQVAETLVETWIHHGDFLLDQIPSADFVIGNPPYVRLEEVDDELSAAYRKRCKRTMGGRADLFVGFYEVGLDTLAEDGVLGFICADRWMRNAYGSGLRKMIVEGPHSVEATIRLHDVDCFEDSVSAYPSITVLRHGEQADGVIVEADASFRPDQVHLVNGFLDGSERQLYDDGLRASRVEGWFDSSPWPEGAPEELVLVAALEKEFDTLEDVLKMTRVGIGVATGADGIYITSDKDTAEPDRMLPLVMAHHIAKGTLEWTPTYLVDPWTPAGLVRLEDFPKLAGHYEEHIEQLGGRHVALKNPDKWFRTIDRVNHWLVDTPKILLADMKARITPVVESGGLYPHHNVYWITSQRWPIEALAGLLLSDFGNLFVKTYCVKMRGGTLRFQAQYLRKIRVPDPSSISVKDMELLAEAYLTRDIERANAIAEELYGHRYPELRI